MILKFVFLYTIALFLNIPCGFYRRNYRKFSFMWFFLIHVPIPFVVWMRHLFGIEFEWWVLLISITICILGQTIGSRVVPRLLKLNDPVKQKA